MYPTRKYNKSTEGMSVIEILVVTFVITVTLTSLLGLASYSLGISTLLKQTNAANNLAQEEMEAVRNFRDSTQWNTNGLGKLATSTDYFPRATGTPAMWELTLGKETLDIFERKVVFEDVRRDVNFNIAASGGTLDPDTKKITAIVSWPTRSGTRQVKLITYLTNWKK